MAKKQTKYVFVLGGVISSIGKGITAASLGALIEERGVHINLVKCDPYLNIDPGTMSPYQHGEVYVTEDGAETDLDLGHYERYTKISLTKKNSITLGGILEGILDQERKGGFAGRTVQFVPDITDAIKNKIYELGRSKPGVLIVEVGGTVGDMESQSFCEAIRQMRTELGTENSSVVYVTYVPYIPSAKELKTKPTQNAVKKLHELGIDLDFLICRSDRVVPLSICQKISKNCNVKIENVLSLEDSKSLYEVPIKLHQKKLDVSLLKSMKLKFEKNISIEAWKKAVSTLESEKDTVRVAIVGKYHKLEDSYKSIYAALREASIDQKVNIEIIPIDSDSITSLKKASALLGEAHCVLIPGGFGTRGLLGKMLAADWARRSQTPFFGICFGMQAAILSFARYVCNIKGATTSEVKKSKTNCLFDLIDEKSAKKIGGTMRLGAYPILLKAKSQMHKAYGKSKVLERHRHRYFFQKDYQKLLEKNGMVFSGWSEPKFLSAIELKDHPWFVGVQYHPEFKSRMNKPHPLFQSFVKAGLSNSRKD